MQMRSKDVTARAKVTIGREGEDEWPLVSFYGKNVFPDMLIITFDCDAPATWQITEVHVSGLTRKVKDVWTGKRMSFDWTREDIPAWMTSMIELALSSLPSPMVFV